MLIAKGVTTEVETTVAAPDSTDSLSGREGGEEEEGKADDSADGKLLRGTRYCTVYCRHGAGLEKCAETHPQQLQTTR